MTSSPFHSGQMPNCPFNNFGSRPSLSWPCFSCLHFQTLLLAVMSLTCAGTAPYLRRCVFTLQQIVFQKGVPWHELWYWPCLISCQPSYNRRSTTVAISMLKLMRWDPNVWHSSKATLNTTYLNTVSNPLWITQNGNVYPNIGVTSAKYSWAVWSEFSCYKTWL